MREKSAVFFVRAPMKRTLCLTMTLLLVGAAGAPAQESLATADEISFAVFADHCRALLQALARCEAPLPAETDEAVRLLLKDGSEDPEAVVKIQKLLDQHCLVGVTINPESRVKVARGPAAAELALDRHTVMLVKVLNEAGVTHPLQVEGPHVRSARQKDGWLEAVVFSRPPLGKTLSGQKVEYVLLRLTASEAGKREATLRFDVGQGTQDLGFRGEVPVLFTVKSEK
jgi:hypothetical protein